MDYYENYLLDTHSYDLTNYEKELLNACIWLVDNRASIRVTARNFLMTKTKLHKDIHDKLRKISYELYKCVCKQLKINKKHRKSGLSC